MVLIQEYLSDPLISWFSKCLESPTEPMTFDDLFQEEPLFKLASKINPQISKWKINPELFKDDTESITRRILENFLKNLQNFYEENLNKTVVKIPEIEKMVGNYVENIDELKSLILIFVGCAVQCGEKNWFREKILDLEWEAFIAFLDSFEKLKILVKAKPKEKIFGQFRNMFAANQKGKKELSLEESVDCCGSEKSVEIAQEAENWRHSMHCLTMNLYKLKMRKMHEKLVEIEDVVRKLEEEAKKGEKNDVKENEGGIIDKSVNKKMSVSIFGKFASSLLSAFQSNRCV